RTIQEQGLLQHAREMGEFALTRMRRMMDEHPLIGDVRGLGLMLGMELVRDRVTRERATDEAEEVMYGSLRRGLSFKLTMGNTITLQPPLTITHQEMDEALNILEAAISEVENSR